MTNWLLLECYRLLLLTDLTLYFGRLRGVCALLQRQRVAIRQREARTSVDALCRAMDLAAVLYWKQVLCLQRSAAAAILLRRRGWNAEMVLGSQYIPFKSHAWVEVDGVVVNDKPYVKDIYRVLDRLKAD